MKRFTLIFVLIFTLVISSLTAMAQVETPSAASTRDIVDMRGRTITVPSEVSRIIALDAGALRLVTYLGASDRIIAVEDDGHGREKSDYEFFSLATYRIAYPELRDLPSIGGAANIEGIIAADADLIISSTVDVAKLDQMQQSFGVPVFAVDVDVELYDADRFFGQNERLGILLGKEDRAEELNNGIRTLLADLAQRKAHVSDPTAAYAGGMMFYGQADLLRTTGDFLPFDLVGATNVMATNPTGNMQPYMTSLEELVAAQPTAIFLDAANLELSKQGYETNKRVLQELVPAFINKDVYSTFVYKYYGTNWDNQLVNVYYVGATLYPELYSDISLEEKAEEIWHLFFNRFISYDEVCALQGARPSRIDWF